MLVGNIVPDGAEPVAQAYAGHQFGGLSPRLGDGRALLLGEVIDGHGRRRDLHLKGSGHTPFARGGDGKAAVGPMLREYLMGEAMHALGIPTTRALAVVGTGEEVPRDTMLPGAVLVRVAASHLRVGSFQYAAMQPDPTLLRRLADHAIARHHPQAAEAAQPYVALLAGVVEAQAALVAQWMLVGFIHGVMNTDNMTISGETIDYGPCAFMDVYDPATVFSSIDHGGRYAFGNQPLIAQWNLARLAEALLPLIDEDTPTAVAVATEVLQTFVPRFESHRLDGMRTKLGLADEHVDDAAIGRRRARPAARAGDRRHLVVPGPVGCGARRRRSGPGPCSLSRMRSTGGPRAGRRGSARRRVDIAAAMDRVNPIYIPRNHLVEEALDAATAGNLDPFNRLLDVLASPFVERSGLEAYAAPAPASFGRYRTFCGT